PAAPGDALEHRAYQVRAGARARDAAKHAARVGVHVRRAEALEGRDRPGAARIGHRGRAGPTLSRRGDDAEPVPEPGYRRARRDGGALQAEGEASGAAP